MKPKEKDGAVLDVRKRLSQPARKRPFLHVIINYTSLKMALLETEI